MAVAGEGAVVAVRVSSMLHGATTPLTPQTRPELPMSAVQQSVSSVVLCF